MSSILFSSQSTTPSPLSRVLPADGDVLEHVRVRAVKHDLPPRTTGRSRSSSQSSSVSSSSSSGDLTSAFMPSSPNHHPCPLFSRRGSMPSSCSEDDHTITPIRLAHASESSRDITQAFNASATATPPRDPRTFPSFLRLTPPGSPSPYLSDGRRRLSTLSLVSSNSRESLRRQSSVASIPAEDLYYTPPENPFSAARRALQAPESVEEEEDITACYNVLGFEGFGI